VLMVSRITPRQVLTRMTKGERIAFVDARTDEAWRTSGLRLTGAVRVRVGSMTRDATQVPASCLVVVYGSGNDDVDVPRVADGLRALGFGEVRVLAGGFAGWVDQRCAVQDARDVAAAAA
jgi:rhodanese-related sulfurtransferase